MDYDLENTIAFKINQLSNKLIKNFNQILSTYHITPEQRITLELLNKNNNLKQSDIVAILGKDKTTVSRSIKSLENKNYIKKIETKEDKRSSFLQIEDQGKKVLENSHNTVSSFRNKINQTLNEEEKQTLFLLLQKITKEL